MLPSTLTHKSQSVMHKKTKTKKLEQNSTEILLYHMRRAEKRTLKANYKTTAPMQSQANVFFSILSVGAVTLWWKPRMGGYLALLLYNNDWTNSCDCFSSNIIIKWPVFRTFFSFSFYLRLFLYFFFRLEHFNSHTKLWGKKATQFT